jgi:hypothetical protein
MLNKSVIISEITNSNNLAKPNILMISAVYLVMNVYDTVSTYANNCNSKKIFFILFNLNIYINSYVQAFSS